jgi:hypothetical protein
MIIIYPNRNHPATDPLNCFSRLEYDGQYFHLSDVELYYNYCFLVRTTTNEQYGMQYGIGQYNSSWPYQEIEQPMIYSEEYNVFYVYETWEGVDWDFNLTEMNGFVNFWFFEFENNTTKKLVAWTDESGSWVHSLEVKADEKQITCYPNPVSDYLNINFEQEGSFHYQILDIQGRNVLSGTTSGRGIDMFGLRNGLYILHIFNERQTHFFRIIKE